MKKYSFDKDWNCDGTCHVEEDVNGNFYSVDEVDTTIYFLNLRIKLLEDKLEQIWDIARQ